MSIYMLEIGFSQLSLAKSNLQHVRFLNNLRMGCVCMVPHFWACAAAVGVEPPEPVEFDPQALSPTPITNTKSPRLSIINVLDRRFCAARPCLFANIFPSSVPV